MLLIDRMYNENEKCVNSILLMLAFGNTESLQFAHMWRVTTLLSLILFSGCLYQVAGIRVGASGAIVISSLQTGGSTNASAEFIKLTNISGLVVAVDGWKLKYASVSGASFSTKATLQGAIGSNETILIATNAYGAVEPHQVMTDGLAQAGGHIQLVDSTNQIVDLVGWGTAAHAEGSPAPAPSAGQTIERKQNVANTFIDTDNNLNDFALLELTTPPSTLLESPPGPVSNNGLKMPFITELLPNPSVPLTDKHDEFIELYNPNPQSFVLSGFKLQTGSSFSYSMTFKDEVLLAGAYVVFTSGATPLTLSNSGGAARLLDSAGTVVSQATSYTTAAEGQSWALIDGSWYWTSSPTPSAPNSLTTSPASSSKPATKSSTATKAKKTSVKAATTTKSAKTGGARASDNSYDEAKTPSRLHPAILAGVGGLALTYGVYEYRHDIKNALYKLKRYRSARRANRQST